MKSWIESFTDCEKLVQAVLKNVPETRGDDYKLLTVVWSMQGFKLTVEQYRAFRRCFTPETITRCRRKVQEKGIYLPVKEVSEQRTLLDDKVGNYLRSKDGD